MNNMEIQREAIIKIVGTQYEGRALNHQSPFLQQNLIMKHQSDNIHDHNAIVLITNDGKELGFMPKGYASLYAPAIDSGRYNFAVEIVKTEPDPKRPTLIIKITSELKNHNEEEEEEIEKDILKFVQNIVNGHAQMTTEYLKFIYSETVNIDELLFALNKVRLIQKLHSYSSSIIKSRGIEQTSDKYTPLAKESLTKYLSSLKADVNDVLKKIQKMYNESLDIDDDDEYHRVQSEIRERRKKFRLYDELLTSFLDAVRGYVNISVNTSYPVVQNQEPKLLESVPERTDVSSITDITIPESEPVPTPEPEHEQVLPKKTQLTDQAFFDWLVSEGGVSDTTAKQYISNVHSIEKLYQTLYGVRRNLLGTSSADNAKVMIEMLIQRSEYIDANERKHNSFRATLNKFAQFAGFSVGESRNLATRKIIQTPISQEQYTIKTVDFDNPHDCTYYKPCYFILNEVKYAVGSWRELYTKFLILLYTNNAYSNIMKSIIGKSLYGRRIDFADKALSHYLRSPIRVSVNFFAEGNLSTADIIKRIKCLMELCSINDSQMVIEYIAHDKNDEITSADNANSYVSDDYEQLSMLVITDHSSAKAIDEEPVEQQADDRPTESVTPDNMKPFVLKDAVIEILSSDASEITKYREHKDGISSKNLRKLLKDYYGKTIGLFEISKLLMMDKTFQSVGKGCYILNEAMIPHKVEYSEPVSQEIENEDPVEAIVKTVHTDYTSASYDDQTVDTTDTLNEEDLTIESILDVIKENSDNLQYEDGFGTYEIKTLLSHKSIINVSEEQIEALMSECPELQQVEDGYYSLIDEEEISSESLPEQTVLVKDKSEDEIVDTITADTSSQEQQEINADVRHIVLRLNGNIVKAYDYSDALSKVCEFSINYKPFRMARIAGQGINLNGNIVFYRKAVPVDGYNKLSNGLQILTIDSLSDLQTIVKEVQKYCQISDDMITIISQ